MATAEIINDVENKNSKKEKSKAELKDYWKNVSEFEEKFYALMFELNLYNKFEDTYTLHIMEETNYGYYAQLYLKTGLSFTSLQQNLETIQQNLKCLWVMKIIPFQEFAHVQILTKPLDENIEYVNPKIKPWEMYMGLNFTLNPIINKNVNELCMFLLSGATRSGKTRLIYCILLSWILSCTPLEVELFLTDIAKDEYINFEYVEHVKYYANSLEKLHEMMLLLKVKFNDRKQLMSGLRKGGNGTNIVDYNKFHKNNKLAYCYVLIDELSIIMPDNSDSQDKKDIKNEILDIIKMLEKTGAGMGIFMITATQKTSKEEMIPIIKNMSSVRISLRANDRASSEVVMGDSSAVGLANRYAVYSFNGGADKEYLFSPYLSMDMLNDLLKPYIKNEYQIVKTTESQKIKPIEITHRKKYDGMTKEEILKMWKKEKQGYEEIIALYPKGDDSEYVDY